MELEKVLLITATAFAIGFIALPSTVTLFHGQHIWYGLANGKELPCIKCHADVYIELRQSAHRNLSCYSCHRANKSIVYANVGTTYINVTPGVQAHAASVVACMLCHQINATNASRTPGPYAGGFNVTMLGVTSCYNYSNATYNGIVAAHNPFVAYSINKSSPLLDSTEACLACHAAVNVTMTFTTSTGINVTVVDEPLGLSSITGLNESSANVTYAKVTGFKRVVEVKIS